MLSDQQSDWVKRKAELDKAEQDGADETTMTTSDVSGWLASLTTSANAGEEDEVQDFM